MAVGRGTVGADAGGPDVLLGDTQGRGAAKGSCDPRKSEIEQQAFTQVRAPWFKREFILRPDGKKREKI